MRRAHARLGFLPLAALALVLAGCPDGNHPPPQGLIQDPDAVLALAEGRLIEVDTLAAEARVSYYGEAQARKGKMSILARRPAYLHFSALSPTDDLIAVLASDGGSFTSFERGGEVCQVGRSCPENVGRFLPIPLAGQDLVTLLMGGAPLIEAAEREVSWDRRAGAYRVVLRDGDGATESIWISHGSGVVRRIRLDDKGKKVLEVTFEDIAPVGKVPMPHTIRALITRGGHDLKISYRQVDLNLELGDDAFSIPCPEGMSVQPLPCPDELQPRPEL